MSRSSVAGNFSVTCWPGSSAASGAQEVRPGHWALVVHLDPETLVVSAPPFPGGLHAFGRWCRELSREAGRLAALTDPAGEFPARTESEAVAAGPEDGPRHRLDKEG